MRTPPVSESGSLAMAAIFTMTSIAMTTRRSRGGLRGANSSMLIVILDRLEASILRCSKHDEFVLVAAGFDGLLAELYDGNCSRGDIVGTRREQRRVAAGALDPLLSLCPLTPLL